MNASASLLVQVAPNLALAHAIGQLVNEFYQETVGDRHAPRLRLITQELVENAVVHATGGDLRLSIDVTPEEDGVRVQVATWNQAEEQRAERVRQTLAALEGAGNVAAQYEAAMHNAARRPQGPGLGLMRLKAECDATLRHRVDENGVLQIVAEARIPR